ncbi:MAG: DUF6732 family protein [Pseudomonadota bacterium]|nr:DUF6732 family protein [Pseudomonadota bacterium]
MTVHPPKSIFMSLAGALGPWLAPVSAHAHLGHVGEMAGHAHWLGYGAMAAAAAAAALLAKGRKKDDRGEGAEEEIAGDEEAVDSQARTGAT